MALMGAVSLFLLGLVSAVLSRLLADEFKAWNPIIIRRLIEYAVARLAENQRPRFEEEWRSHINDVPGEIGRLFTAFGFSLAARKITTLHRDPFSPFNLFLIRFRDLLSCSALIAVAAPIYLFSFIATKLLSAGPILIKVSKVGRGGRMFGLYKLRVTKETPAGRLLIRFAIDQLPVLFNILRGDMSLVGPSPQSLVTVTKRLSEAAASTDILWSERLSVLPGVTGLAQINMPDFTHKDWASEELAYDLYYIRNRTFKLDLLILWRTILRAIRRSR